MNRRDLLKTTVPLALLGPATGCSTLQKLLVDAARELIKEPKVSIAGMRVTGMSLTTIDTLFNVQIENPNPIGIKLAGLDWDLAVDGKKLASGKSTKGVDLPKEATATSDFVVQFPLVEVASSLFDVLQKETVDYVLDAVFKVGTEEQSFQIPATHKGKAPVPKPPVLGVKTVKFTNVSVAGLGAKIVLTAQNPNDFDIPVDKFNASVTFNGHKVLRNANVDGVLIKRKALSEVPVEFTVGLADIGLSIAALALKPEISWKVEYNMFTEGEPLPFEKSGTVKLISQ